MEVSHVLLARVKGGLFPPQQGRIQQGPKAKEYSTERRGKPSMSSFNHYCKHQKICGETMLNVVLKHLQRSQLQRGVGSWGTATALSQLAVSV